MVFHNPSRQFNIGKCFRFFSFYFSIRFKPSSTQCPESNDAKIFEIGPSEKKLCGHKNAPKCFARSALVFNIGLCSLNYLRLNGSLNVEFLLHSCVVHGL